MNWMVVANSCVVPSLIYTFAYFCASQVVHSDYNHDLSGGTVAYTIDVAHIRVWCICEGNNTFQKEDIALSRFVSRGCDMNMHALRVYLFYS
jgi:hypothetical protein